MRSKNRDDEKLGDTSPANNDFGYNKNSDPQDNFHPVKADSDGLVCPFAAHIRKVNPRDLTTDQGAPSHTLVHRMLRRGIPYGSPLPLGATEDLSNQERGLLFLSYQASIREQFEFLSRVWMNDKVNPAQVESGFDMVVGQNPTDALRQRFCILKGEDGVKEKISTEGSPQSDWVISTGGGYFFAPSRFAIQNVLIPSG